MWNKPIKFLNECEQSKIEKLRMKVDSILDPNLNYSDFNAIRSTIANYKNKINNSAFKDCLSEVNNRFEGAMRIRRKLQNCEYKIEKILNKSIAYAAKISKPAHQSLLKKVKDILKNSSSCKFKFSDYDELNKNLLISIDCSDENSETLKILSQMGFRKY